jgi:hypothetical protein
MWVLTAPPIVVAADPGIDTTGWAIIISTLFASITTTAVAIITALRVGTVEREVKTMNELTIGQLAERGETRRIEGSVPEGDRTAQEARHVQMAHDRHDDAAPS